MRITMPLFRKKPVVIEAIEISDENLVALLNLAQQRNDLKTFCQTVDGTDMITNRVSHVEIATLEGVMTGGRGDWLIIGVNGEAYPCKADVFAKTYDAVDAEPA
jgi:hypothetical protein